MSKFETDLKKAQKIELEFEAYIRTEYGFLTENTQHLGFFPDYDVRITSTTTNNISTYEVKLNSNYANNTVCIEIGKRINGKDEPSGLSSTKADYYVLKIEADDNWYVIPTQKLKDLLSGDTRQNYTMLDKNDFMITISQKAWLLQHFTTI